MLLEDLYLLAKEFLHLKDTIIACLLSDEKLGENIYNSLIDFYLHLRQVYIALKYLFKPIYNRITASWCRLQLAL
jgi:hypothetical protein